MFREVKKIGKGGGMKTYKNNKHRSHISGMKRFLASKMGKEKIEREKEKIRYFNQKKLKEVLWLLQ